jgi:hypothetical protein
MKTRIDDYRPTDDYSNTPLFGGEKPTTTPPPAPSPAPAARATDPATSHEAAGGAKQFSGRHHALILEALKDGPASKTVLGDRIGLDGVSVARRTSELVSTGQIVVVSRDGISPSGHPERVYDLPRRDPK